MKIKNFDWDKISNARDEDERMDITYAQMGDMEYFHLSDILTHRDKGAGGVLRILDKQFNCGNGIQTPSPAGQYRLRPYRQYAKPDTAPEDAFRYEPGEVVTWKQQMYNRMPQGPFKGQSKKKLTKMEMEAMRKRGELDKIIDIGRAVVDEHGLITVSYQDACQLLANNGFRRVSYYDEEMSVAICNREEISARQVRHSTDLGKVVLQTRRNWLFEEILPHDDPARVKTYKTETVQDDEYEVVTDLTEEEEIAAMIAAEENE